MEGYGRSLFWVMAGCILTEFIHVLKSDLVGWVKLSVQPNKNLLMLG